MSQSDIINAVLKLRGESYTFTAMSIDPSESEIWELTKNAQANEFAYVASVRLCIQREM